MTHITQVPSPQSPGASNKDEHFHELEADTRGDRGAGKLHALPPPEQL